MTIKHHTINLAAIYMVTFLAVLILFSPLGPYMCAQDLNTCIYDPALISVAELVSLTNVAAQNNEIDSTSNLKNDRVYLFSGTIDTIVNPGKSPRFVSLHFCLCYSQHNCSYVRGWSYMFMCYHIAGRITYFVGENIRMHVCVHVCICMCKHGRQVYYNYQFTSYSITKEYFL